MGALCLATSLACYLASAEPHVQMEILNVQLIPILQERGINLCWKLHNDFVQVISDVSKPCAVEENVKRDNSTQSDSVEDLSTKQPLGMCRELHVTYT